MFLSSSKFSESLKMAEVKKLKCVINGSLSKVATCVVGSKERKKRKRSTKKTKPKSNVTASKFEYELEPIPCQSDQFQKTENLPFETPEVYRGLLKSKSAIVPVDPCFNAFLVQSFDIKKAVLQNYYVILKRKLFRLRDNNQWIFSCSCDKARQRLLDNLPDEINEDLDIGKIYEECIHVKSAKPIVMAFSNDYDVSIDTSTCTATSEDHAYDKQMPNRKVDIYGVPDNNTIVCVRWEEEGNASYHIIRVAYTSKDPELNCVTCKSHNCFHCKEILQQDINAADLPSSILQALNETIKWRSRYVPTSVSSQKIAFSCSPEEQKTNRDSLRDSGDFLHFQPSSAGSCACGGYWGEPCLQGEVKVYTDFNIVNTKVYSRSCVDTSCAGMKEYDGCEDQVLNMGTYMVSHSVLRDYLKQFVTQGCTMAAYYKQWCWRQVESGNLNFLEEFPYNRFRYAWYCFLQLLDIHYEDGFSCPECGDAPDTVVMDGVSLGLRRTFMPWGPYFSGKGSSIFDGSSHSTRVFINNHDTRQLLIKFVEKGLTYEEMVLLKEKFVRYRPSLSPLFEYFFDNRMYISPPVYKDFLLLLSSNYPVCGFLHFNEQLFVLFNNLDKFTVGEMVLIERETPVISILFKQLGWKIPSTLKPIFKELVCKAKAPFEGKCHNIQKCDDNCNCQGEGYFPSLPTLCHRGNFAMDNKLKKKNNCTKRRTTHPSLIPGLFTISCIHGICYGYDIMENSESPNIPFTILRTRFQRAPKLIIYDNSCNLQEYCLNRDPVFFRDSWFVIDRFHWCNHVGCHSGYNLDSYPQYKNINTQVAEQRNATFKKLKSMLSYMNLKNFKGHLNLFIWFRNMLSLSSTGADILAKDILLFKELSKVYTTTKC